MSVLRERNKAGALREAAGFVEFVCLILWSCPSGSVELDGSKLKAEHFHHFDESFEGHVCAKRQIGWNREALHATGAHKSFGNAGGIAG